MNHTFVTRLSIAAAIVGLLLAAVTTQTLGEPEQFSAVAIMNNTVGTGAGRVEMRITRWSTPAERQGLVNALVSQGPEDLLRRLRNERSVGTIRTPDSLAYDLRYASQTPTDEGGRRIVLATDRPIGFWEAVNRPRISDYPFVVIQMELGRDGKGKGTLSYFTKIQAHDDTIELEGFANQPAMLTEITSTKDRHK